MTHHNLGNSLTLADADGTTLDVTTTCHNGDLRATSTVDASDDNPRIDMKMWMLGQEGRTVYRIDGPGTTTLTNVTPNAVNQKPQSTPTLIVRQQGNNAAAAPFVSVFEPSANGTGAVRNVTRLDGHGTFAGLRVHSDGAGELHERVEYILASIDAKAYSPHYDLDFTGAVGAVRANGGTPRYLYLGSGLDLRHRDHRITADGPTAVAAGLVRTRDGMRYSADAWIRITLPCGGRVHRARIAYETEDGFVFAQTTASPTERTVTGLVPAGYNVRIKAVTTNRN